MKKSCLECGKEFRTYPSRIKIGLGKYCGRECSGKNTCFKNGDKYWLGKKRPDLKKTDSIKTMFRKGQTPWNKGRVWPADVRLKISLSNKGKHSGSKNNMWKGGVTDENLRMRWSQEYKDWRKAIFKRDDYTCIICDSRGVFLNADHIKPFSLYPELRLDMNNGRTLCVKCHKIHGWNKYKNNYETKTA